MKITAALIAILAVFIFTGCGSSQPAAGTESYIAEGYQKKKYGRILVLGTMKDDVARKKVETEMTDLLNRSGYKAGPAYTSFSMANISSRDSLEATLKPLEFDAVVVLTYMGSQSAINDQVKVSSTTPIASLSLFDIYTSPAYDLVYDAQQRITGYVYASFYTRDKYEKQWGSTMQVNMSNGLDMASELLAGSVLARMKRDKIL